jgi:selenocysteine lyase/cysteine desulfurase
MLAPDRFDPPPGYLDTATVGVPPRTAHEEMRSELAVWAEGRADARGYDRWVEEGRASFGRIVGVPADWVAIGSQLSVFMGVVAAALPPGSEVLSYRGDFTSVLFPPLAQEHRLRVVELDEVAEAVGPATALVAISSVQSSDGARADLDAIAAAAAEHESLVFVDATQSCGWLPIDASRFDFVACAAYKWLLSPRGVAFMTIRPERLAQVPPLAAGWYAGADRWASIYEEPLRLAANARRLDVSPAWLCWVGAVPALRVFEEVGVAAICEHDLRLANRLRAGLGMPEHGSAIVSVKTPGAAEKLARAGVRAAGRGDGVRLSFHLYNDEADVDLALEALGATGRPAGAGSWDRPR